MTHIFDGKNFAREKETKLKEEVKRLKKDSITPKLVSILIGNYPASVLYTNLKEKTAERLGCKLEVIRLSQAVSVNQIIDRIMEFNSDESVHGVMVQLPLPDNFSVNDRDKIINSISVEKDVDGMRDDSHFIAPTAKAVFEIVQLACKGYLKEHKVVVVGDKGFEGRKIVNALIKEGYEVVGIDKEVKDLQLVTKNADILISVTGSPGIIGADEIKEGAVAIDVGSPKGDVRTEEVIGKASFISPVPGGVGPLTISFLIENLLVASGRL